MGDLDYFRKKTWNLTEQGQIAKNNPDYADQLREKARQLDAVAAAAPSPEQRWETLTRDGHAQLLRRIHGLEQQLRTTRSELARKGEALRALQADHNSLQNRLKASESEDSSKGE